MSRICIANLRKCANFSRFILHRDLSAELPFVLMHPKPEDDDEGPPLGKSVSPNHLGEGSDVPVDNLIQLDT